MRAFDARLPRGTSEVNANHLEILNGGGYGGTAMGCGVVRAPGVMVETVGVEFFCSTACVTALAI